MGGAMGRNLVQSCGLLVAIGIAFQPADAGDRKSAARLQEVQDEILVVRKSQGPSLQNEMLGASTTRPLETRLSAFADHRSIKDSKRENAAASASEHKPVTLFHFNSKLGDVSVQPVIGHVNGAQFSL